MAGLFNELKRRNVFKVAAAYLVVGWILLQVATTIAPIMQLPDSAPRYVLFFLVILFPIALFLAWAFEITPTHELNNELQAKAKGAFPLLVAVSLLGIIGFYIFDDTSSEKTLQNTDGFPSPKNASIAVLSFADLSPKGDHEYFGDGISEALLDVLAKVEELSVSSRTSSFAFKGDRRNITDIASILNVAYVLEGSVKKAGKRILITAQLIDAAQNRHLWSDTFERELTTENIFAIQAEIANSIVAALGTKLGITVNSDITFHKLTENMDAYDLYLQAKKARVFASVTNANKMVEFSEKAVALDPDFAEGWAYLAYSLGRLPSWDNTKESAPLFARSLLAAEKAISLDPQLRRPYDALIAVHMNNHQWEKAYDVVARAQKQISDFDFSAQEFMMLGYLRQAFDKSILESSSNGGVSFTHLMKAQYYSSLGDHVLALDSYHQANLMGYYADLRAFTTEDNWAAGNRQVWTEHFSLYFVEHDPELLPLLPHMYKWQVDMSKDRQKATRQFKTTAREMGFKMKDLVAAGGPHGLSRLPMGLSVALGGSEFIAKQYWGNIPMFFMWSNHHHHFRQSDAFRSRIKSSGLLAYWQKHGWPDLCRAAGEDDFICD